jgi:hypothetical protein
MLSVLSSMPPWEIIFVRMGITFLGCFYYMRWANIPEPLLGPKGVRGLLVLRGVVGFFGLFGI